MVMRLSQGWLQQILVMLGLFSLALVASANSHLNSNSHPAASSIQISKSQIVLGEAVILTVRGKTAVRKFKRLSLTPLQQDFVVDVVDSQRDRIRLKLYPLSSGEFVLSQKVFANLKLEQRRIKVAENPDIDLNWPSMPSNLYPQQVLVHSLNLELPSEAWRLTVEAPFLTQSQSDIWKAQRIEAIRNEENLNYYQVTNIYEMTQFIAPLTTQTALMPRMHLKIHRPNGRPWHFFSPNHMVEVRALPSFLSADSLVAKLDWHSELEAVSELAAINYWRWSFQAANVSPRYMQQLAQKVWQQLASIEKVQWLSPQIELQQWVEGGQLIQSLQLQIPYRPNRLFWEMSQIQIGFFDPNTQQWQQQTLPAGWKLSLPAWVSSVLQLMILGGGLLIGWLLVRLASVIWRWQQLKRRLVLADSVEMTAKALYDWQRQMQGGKNLAVTAKSYGQWLQIYRTNTASSEDAVEAAQALLLLLQQLQFDKPSAAAQTEVGSVTLELKRLVKNWLATESAWRQALRNL